MSPGMFAVVVSRSQGSTGSYPRGSTELRGQRGLGYGCRGVLQDIKPQIVSFKYVLTCTFFIPNKIDMKMLNDSMARHYLN